MILTLFILGCAGSNNGTQQPEVSSTDTNTETPVGEILFQIPLADPSKFSILVGVDHDPTVQDDGISQTICTDYLGRNFPHCYDQHNGNDYMLQGGFAAMDDGSAEIVAAADGIVIETEDGNYDRCHSDIASFDIDCDGYPMRANYVIVAHDTGHKTLYWHMKKDSVAVDVGQTVQSGEVLGLVGSSGKSSQPHLHFEVKSPDGKVINPYAGPYSQPQTYWCAQADPFPGTCE